MFQSPTTVVVGAGASKEYGLPLGSELRHKIAKLIDIYFGANGSIERGDYSIIQALHSFARAKGENSISRFVSRGRQMAEAMSLATSIDNYLDAHRHDADLNICGKLAITKAILDAERESTLYSTFKTSNKFNIEAVEDTWLAKFFRLIVDGADVHDVRTSLKNLTIVSFNYDRCVEVFLRQALSTYYNLQFVEAAELMSELSILHPYGCVGKVPKIGEVGTEFGANCSGPQLLEVSSGIKLLQNK